MRLYVKIFIIILVTICIGLAAYFLLVRKRKQTLTVVKFSQLLPSLPPVNQKFKISITADASPDKTTQYLGISSDPDLRIILVKKIENAVIWQLDDKNYLFTTINSVKNYVVFGNNEEAKLEPFNKDNISSYYKIVLVKQYANFFALENTEGNGFMFFKGPAGKVQGASAFTGLENKISLIYETNIMYPVAPPREPSLPPSNKKFKISVIDYSASDLPVSYLSISSTSGYLQVSFTKNLDEATVWQFDSDNYIFTTINGVPNYVAYGDQAYAKVVPYSKDEVSIYYKIVVLKKYSNFYALQNTTYGGFMYFDISNDAIIGFAFKGVQNKINLLPQDS